MKRIIASLALASLAGSAQAGLWDLYDGDGTVLEPDGTVIKVATQEGVECNFYNRMAGLRWKNRGGDWIDGADQEQGSVPWTFVNLGVISTPTALEIDITPLLWRGALIMRRNNSAVVKFASRESTTPPVIEVTRTNGEVVTLPITADASLLTMSGSTSCNGTGLQKSTTLNVAPSVVMGWGQWPADAQSAVLKITATQVTSSTQVQFFAMRVPNDPTSQVNAVPVSANPQIIWSEDFNANMPQWWANLGYPVTPSAQWTQDSGFGITPGQSGAWRANPALPDTMVPAQGAPGLMVPRGAGYGNTPGLMFVHHPTKLAFGVEMRNVSTLGLLGTEQDEMWFRYRVKFGDEFHTFRKAEGGKLPGLKGTTTYCSGSGVRSNGLCGWSLRGGFVSMSDTNNPGFSYVRVNTYAYHAKQPGFYGSSWDGDARLLIPRNEWACIEQRVKLNTPGVDDGINQLYVNGELSLDKRDMYLRAVKPAQGYGDWWVNEPASPMPAGAPSVFDPLMNRTLWWRGGASSSTDLGIQGMYWVQHGGGQTPMGKSPQMWFDDFVISLDRVGCE